MVEANRKRINLGDKMNWEERAIGNPSKATELITKISNVETDKKHGDSSRLQVARHISSRDDGERSNLNYIGDDADSENIFELNQSLSEGKNIEKEQIEKTFNAIAHFNHV